MARKSAAQKQAEDEAAAAEAAQNEEVVAPGETVELDESEDEGSFAGDPPEDVVDSDEDAARDAHLKVESNAAKKARLARQDKEVQKAAQPAKAWLEVNGNKIVRCTRKKNGNLAREYLGSRKKNGELWLKIAKVHKGKMPVAI